MDTKQRRTVQPLEVRIKMLKYIKEQCDNNGMLQDHFLYSTYGITRSLAKLLKLGVIEKGKITHSYKWVSTESPEEIATVVWNHSGAGKPIEPESAKKDLTEIVLQATQFARDYKVADEKQFLRDVIEGKVSVVYNQ
jgi:hypothetical protein